MVFFGTNTCVTQSFYNNYYIWKEEKYRVIKSRLQEIADTKTNVKIPNIIEAITKYQDDKNQSISSEWKRSVYNYILDELKNILDERYDIQYKAHQDIESWYKEFDLSLSKWATWKCYDGYCIIIDEYENKSKTEISNYAYRLSEEIYEYNMEYDFLFKLNHDGEINRLVALWWNRDDIVRWIKEWFVEWTHDYLMQYYELWETLAGLKLEKIFEGVRWAWNTIKNPWDVITAFKDTVKSLYDKLIGLTWYEWAKGSSYVGTTVSMWTVDPTWKILMLGWVGFFTKVSWKVDNILIWWIKYNTKVLDQMAIRNWSKSDIEETIRNPYKKGKSVDNYNWKNDPATVYFISDNQYVVINNNDLSITQVSDKNDSNWVIDGRIYDIK